MEDLKDYREKELKIYFIGNILILLLAQKNIHKLFFIIDTIEEMGNTKEMLASLFVTFVSSGFISAIAYIYLFILDSLIAGNIKTTICNLGRKMPGEFIFEEIVNKNMDKRFMKEDAQKCYASTYSKLATLDKKVKCHFSNSAWYEIYKKHKSEPSIFHSNRDYLLCRDLCFSTLCLICIYLILVFLGILNFYMKTLICLLIELVFTNIATYSKSKRLAYNVIAADITRNE